MQDSEERKLFRAVYTKIATVLVGMFITASVGLTTFYFSTQHVTAQNTKDILEQKIDVKKIKDDVSKIKTVPVINQLQIQAIKKDVNRIEESTKEMGKKIDKMMEILLVIKARNPND
jgi:uncharacterized protein HemX